MAGVGKKTGIKAEIHAMDWGEALRRMRMGEFDVIDSIVETAERRDSFDFTQAYTTIEASIYFRHDISGITDLASLKGFPVGVKTGDQHVELLKANGATTVIRFKITRRSSRRRSSTKSTSLWSMTRQRFIF